MIRKFYLIAVSCLALSGCISLLPEAGPGPDIYRLTKVSMPAMGSLEKQVVLLSLVQAPRELKNNRVALMQGGQTIAYAANARWAASTPEMLQVLIADSLQATGAVQVVLPADGVRADTVLRVTLREFEAIYDQGKEAAPMGRVTYRVQWIERSSRDLLGEQTFSSSSRSSDVRLSSVVSAIDMAAHNAASDLAAWVKAGIADGTNGS